jgi:hypothetical protein
MHLRGSRLDLNYTIIIPFYRETTALQFSRFYFDSLRIKPIYVLDSKQIARRKEAEDILGQPVAVYNNPGGFVEAHFDRLAALAPTDWILRIDCDEAPNPALLEHCARFVKRPTSNLCGFDRDDLLWRGNRFQRLKYSPLFFDSQFRLFNRRQVKFISETHTPGYHVPKWKVPLVPLWHGPLNARIYHLQRTFEPAEKRAARMTGRTDYQTGAGAKFREWNLRPDESFQWRSFNDRWFTELFAAWFKGKEIPSR